MYIQLRFPSSVVSFHTRSNESCSHLLNMMIMKLSFLRTISSLLLLVTCNAGTCNAAVRPHVVPAAATTKPTTTTTATITALQQIRGGDDGILGTPVTQKQLAALLVTYQAINSLVGIPAPEILSKMYSGESFESGSADEVLWSLIGSGMASIGIMTYLDVFTDNTDPAKIALAGTIPCGYVAWKLFLTDAFQKAGLKEGAGLIMVLSFVPALFLAMGKGDEQLIIKYFATVCTVSGLTSMLGSTELMKNLYGVSIDGPTISNNKWMGRFNLLCGIIFWGLSDLVDMTAIQKIGIVALTLAAFIIDHGYIQKDADLLPKQDKSINPIVALFNFIVGAGILAGEKQSSPPVTE